ncbi:MAG: RagB/SusD family nutrient uptake outer membrane protein [Saprospiraceae bacterium]|nr:RagB/SusD family nutrient uptake outer membrane protein [Saprospiraceae bacterium]
MKNFKYILSLCLALSFGSCSKEFLEIEPQDRLTADNFYKTAGEIKAATASLYGFPWFDFNDKFFWLAGDVMSGNMYYTYDQEGQFFFFSYSGGNAHLTSGWKGLFRVVSYANSIINDMPRAAAGKVDQVTIDRALGEARFVRAYCYYMLAEYWGDVPIVENSTELVATNNLFLPKNTRSSVLEFVRRDLVFAADNLPAADAPGRVTKWAAKALLAKVHLTLASNLSDAASAENFTKAKDYAADVLTNSGLTLMPNYADLFKIDNNNNPESLFALQWMEGSYAFGNSRQANWARGSQITGNSECWGGGKSATYDFVTSIEPADKRRAAIFMALGDHYPEIRKADGGYTYNIVSRDPNDQNIVLEGAAPVLNNAKKYIVGSAADTDGKVSTGQATAINQYMIRLADVYLTYAEAALGGAASSSDAQALTYLNAIRQRAGLPAKSSFTFADILRERRVEFGFESMYWFDVKRAFYRDPNGTIADLNAQQREITYQRDFSPNAADENSVAGYTVVPPPSPIIIAASHMWMPIPASEIVTNALLAPSAPAEDYKF